MPAPTAKSAMARPLTVDQRKVLAAIQEEADRDIAGLRVATGLSMTMVREAMRMLRWRGLVPWKSKAPVVPVQTASRIPQTGHDYLKATGEITKALPPLAPSSPQLPGRREPLQIGDVLPLGPDFDRSAWIQHKRRMLVHRKPATSPIRATLKLQADAAAALEQQRRECPIEQAKTIIRRTGVAVYAASVIDRKAKGFQVGSRRLSEQELLAHAAAIQKRAESRSAPD